MTEFVKDFIENNIKLINAEDWKQVFNNWTMIAESLWPSDTAEFVELLNTLISAGIDVNLEARDEVIFEDVVAICEYIMNNQSEETFKKFIGISRIKHELHSKLGLDDYSLDVIINKAAKSLGLSFNEYFGPGFTWSN